MPPKEAAPSAAVVDQLLRLMPAGQTEAAIKAIPDEAVDLLCIAGTQDECRAKVRAYEGVVEELLLVAVGGDVVGVIQLSGQAESVSNHRAYLAN